MDKLWSRLIAVKFRFKCAICKGAGSDAHHLIGRSSLAFRHSPSNGVLLCRKHHNSAHDGSSAEVTALLGNCLDDIKPSGDITECDLSKMIQDELKKNGYHHLVEKVVRL